MIIGEDRNNWNKKPQSGLPKKSLLNLAVLSRGGSNEICIDEF